MSIVWNIWYKIPLSQFQVHTESSFHHKRHPWRYPWWPRTRNNQVKSWFKSGWWSGKSGFIRGNGSGRQHQLHITDARGGWTSIWSDFTGADKFWFDNSFMGCFLQFIFPNSPIYCFQILFTYFFFAWSKVGRIVKSISSAIYRLFRTRLKKIEQKTK